jgi:hypothetical protein
MTALLIVLTVVGWAGAVYLFTQRAQWRYWIATAISQTSNGRRPWVARENFCQQQLTKVLEEGEYANDLIERLGFMPKIVIKLHEMPYPGKTYCEVTFKGVAGFTLTQLPGCCGVVVSTGAWVNLDHRRKGIGSLMNQLRIDYARALGYGYILCTDVETNEPQRKLLAKNGWVDLTKFTNPRTVNRVFISGKEL